MDSEEKGEIIYIMNKRTIIGSILIVVPIAAILAFGLSLLVVAFIINPIVTSIVVGLILSLVIGHILLEEN